MMDAVHALPFRLARVMARQPLLARFVGVKPDDRPEDLKVPPHVPADRVRDVDIYNLPGATESVYEAWRQVQQSNPDVFYTPRHGGLWVLTRAQLISEAFANPEVYSSFNSIGIPAMPKSAPPMLPIASDKPDHQDYRRPINIALSPRALQSFTVEARSLAIELIEEMLPRGGCDFAKEFAGHLPMTIFLKMVNLPLSDRSYLMHLTERMLHSPSPGDKAAYAMEVFEYLDRWVRARRKNPGDDLLSKIGQIKVAGRPITQFEALGEAAQAMFGGLDTVASTMTFIVHHLATNPEQTAALAADPKLIPQAMEEMIRRHSLPILARRLTRDIELDGVRLLKDEQVMLPITLHNLDDRMWKDPMSVDLNRQTTHHLGFGLGEHKCPGANLARAEIRIFLEEWLKRIPQFSLKPGTKPVNMAGQVVGIKDVHVVWPV